MLSLPWEPGVAACLADIEPAEAAPRSPIRAAPSKRAAAAARRARARADRRPRARVLHRRARPGGAGRYRRHVDQLGMVYTVGPQADPGGLVRGMTESLAQRGSGRSRSNHEFMNSQYEINLRSAGALIAADRASRLKSAVKDIAAQHGLWRRSWASRSMTRAARACTCICR